MDKIGPKSIAMSGSEPIRDDTREQLRSVQEECKRLREENTRLKAMLGILESVGDVVAASHTEVSAANASKSGTDVSTPEGKINLFRGLFRGREDVYSARWEGKGGKSGYSPAAAMDWHMRCHKG